MKNTFSKTNLVINDILGRSYLNPLGELAYKTAVRKTRLGRASRILDAGCGRGYGIIFLAKSTGGFVTGIDPSPVMLADARRHAAGMRAAKIKFVNAVISGLKKWFFFDLVCCFDVLGFTPDRGRSIKHLSRLLKIGGTLCFSDYICEKNTRSSKNLIRLWNVKSTGTLKSLKDSLQKASFSDIKLRDTTRLYRGHWEKMKKRLAARKTKIVSEVGVNSFKDYLTAIDAIIEATREGSFSHITGYAVKKRMSGKE